MIGKAAGSEADLVFLDLEDSVASNEKAAARRNICDGFRDLDWEGKSRAVRINSLTTEFGADDIEWLIGEAGDVIDCFVVPKVETADDVHHLDELMSDAEGRAGTKLPIGLEVLIESVRGLQNVEQIAACSPRMETVIFGPGDLAADQRMPLQTVGGRNSYPGGDLWYYARMKIILAARAAGIEAVDGPFADFSDEEGYRIEAERACLMGSCGKWAIHPSQVRVANEVFCPTPEQLERAKSLIAAYEEAEAEGKGAIAVDGEMIDAASARILENVVRLAEVAPIDDIVD
jgi:citrate lyase subunit beta / citryl-CoA lyase